MTSYEEVDAGLDVEVSLHADPLSLDSIMLDGSVRFAHCAKSHGWRDDARNDGHFGH
jgi:hypothetical protein